MIYLLSFIILILLLVLIFSIKLNLEYNEKLEELGLQLEESLDIMNDCYGRISKLSDTPVIYDDPMVQQLLFDIKHTRRAILLVANKLVNFDNES